VPIVPWNREVVARIKSFVKEAFEKAGYSGYSIEYDNQFDAHSEYFYVSAPDGKILATSRITDKTGRDPVPFEKALKGDGTSYKVEERGHVGDINSFVFSNFRALPILYAAVARYAELKGMGKGFCLLDEASERIKNIYLGGGFKYSAKYNEKVYFPGFGRVENGALTPTRWSIMEIDRETIMKDSKEADKYLSDSR
jgi:hypothetical protein